MKELVVISGKGGTGKTSIAASFAALARRKVMADCDVDAADLHLILDPSIVSDNPFSGGKLARIDPEKCIACGKCAEVCAFNAISNNGPGNEPVPNVFQVDPIACEGCSVCTYFCPQDAIVFEEVENGRWFISDTRFGPLVHARLGIAQENSGKLVSLVRSQARTLAEKNNLDLVIIDGPPGIGCPVIASIANTDLVLIVTEPTLSGIHDMGRVYKLSAHFNIPAMVCINKSDINPALSDEIRSRSGTLGIPVAAEIPYNNDFTTAQINKLSVVEFSDGPVSSAVRLLWEKLASALV